MQSVKEFDFALVIKDCELALDSRYSPFVEKARTGSAWNCTFLGSKRSCSLRVVTS